MPRYTYRCEGCLEYFEVSHSISDKLTDCTCGSKDSLIRVPSVPFRVSSKGEKKGQLVKEFIEDSKRDVEEYKKDLGKGVENE